MQQNSDIALVTKTAPIATVTHGGRAKCLQRLVRLDLPVPKTVSLSFEMVHRIASNEGMDVANILSEFSQDDLLCVRPSSESPDWGGPRAVLNVGINDAQYERLCNTLGQDAAVQIYLRFVQGYSIHVARLDPDMFDHIQGQDEAALREALDAYEQETEEQFPQDRSVQLAEVLRSMARAWEGTTARLLRQAKGAPADAGLGLVVQKMAFGLGQGEYGSGVLQLVDSQTGHPQITGRYLRQSQWRDALEDGQDSLFLTNDPRGPSLEEVCPDIFEALKAEALRMRIRLREEMQIEFTIEDGVLFILDGVKVARQAPAAVRIAVSLAEDGIISKEEALMRVEPHALGELLHRQVAHGAVRDVIACGIAASPGAATGKIVFSAEDALALQAREEDCILVRRETSPEDIRGMHAAQGVLTERGGMTSHAAVIGRGMGLPCIVGASAIRFHTRRKQLSAPDGRIFREGDIITIDGTTGQILAGAADLVEASMDDKFVTLMEWSTETCDIDVRANADTLVDAKIARDFGAQGIGLCRTEHMFFDAERMTVMQEMIFANSREERETVLERLLPMQRADFIKLFEIMDGMPVCIRLFDPPLHEFLPSDRSGLRDLAEALDLPLSDVTQRVETMSEHNPMLGLRGVRLGISVPEIYEMQARAIFEATIAAQSSGRPIVPEIMIPLVSAKREVELVKSRIDSVAADVRAKTNEHFDYQIGVMVETPRAALRADEIALNSSFLSFGTNDLTQMTYGLSRDDAGRFMGAYVQQGVFHEDPFHILDLDGVGELLRLGSERARTASSEITLSLCGEHGGSPDSIAFCRQNRFDYVSCSPYRVPLARLAAAQLAISEKTA